MKMVFDQSKHNPIFFYVSSEDELEEGEMFTPYAQKAMQEIGKLYKSIQIPSPTSVRFSFDDPADEAEFTLACIDLELEIDK